ncbi:hypothetical protein C8J56DRAFT_1031402 [Mycena floridula]|nr:hypothetical protein C8J56DRAFT_1031402 [Mycena floridula]
MSNPLPCVDSDALVARLRHRGRKLSNCIGDGFSIVMGPFFLYLSSVVRASSPYKNVTDAFFVQLWLSLLLFASSMHTGKDPTNYFLDKLTQIGVAWSTFSVALNIIVTILITYRILKARRSLMKSILGIAFAVVNGRQMQEKSALIFVWVPLAAPSPQFIIFRVVSGRAWTRRAALQFSDINSNTSTFVNTRRCYESPFMGLEYFAGIAKVPEDLNEARAPASNRAASGSENNTIA